MRACWVVLGPDAPRRVSVASLSESDTALAVSTCGKWTDAAPMAPFTGRFFGRSVGLSCEVWNAVFVTDRF